MAELFENPMGTDGFEFVEYAAPDPQGLRTLFERLGFPVVARHRSKNVTRHAQGDINFIINAEEDSFAQGFARAHGPCACAMAFRVRDAAFAYRRALELGARPGPQSAGPMELNIPCIEGIGGSLIYLVDRYGEQSIYDVDFRADRRCRRFGADRPCLHRPSDSQRDARAHGPLDELLRAPVQLSRNSLFRYRGQEDGTLLARTHEPLRPHPHSYQRVAR